MQDARGAVPTQSSKRSRHALDALNFFVADVQTGFGPFVAVYLTAQRWTQVDIGLVFTTGALVGLLFQVPGGAIVDAVRSIRLLAAGAVAAVALSAVALALAPTFPVVLASRILQAAASCLLGPAIVAMSLGLVPRHSAPERLGRNAAFASAGTAIAAGGMGLLGSVLSTTSVFYLSGALAVPALLALARIRESEIDVARAHGADPDEVPAAPAGARGGTPVWRNGPLLVFAACVVLFQMANAAMLPLVGSILTLRTNHEAAALIAVALVVPQLIVAVLAPIVGRAAGRWGRRPLLLVAFGALPIRALLSAQIGNPHLLVAVQLIDGLSAAVLGVIIPLVIADVTRASGQFNLAQGVVGCAVGLGAAASTTIVGYVADHYGSASAFNVMAATAAAGFLAVLLVCPETGTPRARPVRQS